MEAISPNNKFNFVNHKENNYKKIALKNLNDEVSRLMLECKTGEKLFETEKNLLLITEVFRYVQYFKNENISPKLLFQDDKSSLEHFENEYRFILENRVIMESIEQICTHKHSFKKQNNFTKTAEEFLLSFKSNLKNLALNCLTFMDDDAVRASSCFHPVNVTSEIRPFGVKMA